MESRTWSVCSSASGALRDPNVIIALCLAAVVATATAQELGSIWILKVSLQLAGLVACAVLLDYVCSNAKRRMVHAKIAGTGRAAIGGRKETAKCNTSW